jgi:hypothetical protein
LGRRRFVLRQCERLRQSERLACGVLTCELFLTELYSGPRGERSENFAKQWGGKYLRGSPQVVYRAEQAGSAAR